MSYAEAKEIIGNDDELAAELRRWTARFAA
jgi:hypothetical protein